jgi:hypothetical protein
MLTVINHADTVQLTTPFNGLPKDTFIPKDLTNKFYRDVLEAVNTGQAELVPPVEAPPVVPSVITRFQALAQLATLGLLPTVKAIIDTSDNEIMKLAFDNALEFKRTSPMLNELATQLNLTSSDLDSLFIAASKIEV